MTQNTPTPDNTQMQNARRFIRRLIASGMVVNFVLGFAYLIMLNGLATQGFDLETLKAERIELQKQVELVDIALAIPSSIYALESNEAIQEMPLVAQKSFLEIRNAEVAMVIE